MESTDSKKSTETLKSTLEDLKKDLKTLSEQSSTLTGSLKNKLTERFELSTGITQMREQVSIGKQNWQLKLAEMDKDELKEFGTNAEIRNAKIDSSFAQTEAIKTFEIILRKLDHEIEIIKIDLRHLNFEREVLQTILMA